MDSSKKEKLIAAIQDYLDSIEHEEVHCDSCGRWLANEKILMGILQVKCKKCKKYKTVSRVDLDNFFEIIKDFS